MDEKSRESRFESYRTKSPETIKVDHSYAHNLSSPEIQAWRGFEPTSSTGAVSALPTEVLSQLGAGRIVSS